MSKITKALKKASEEKEMHNSQSEESQDKLSANTKEKKMSKSFTWTFLIAVVIVVLVAFNYQSGQDAVPLSEIFPDDVEFEFVQEESDTGKVSKKDHVVQLRVVTEAEPVLIKEESSSVTQTKEFNFTVQIASFKEKKKAQKALTQIRTKVPTAYISTQDLGAKGIWHRVYSGQYELRNEAEVALGDIKQNYDSSFIISPIKAK